LAQELKVSLQKYLAAGFESLFFSTMEFKHLLRSTIKVRDLLSSNKDFKAAVDDDIPIGPQLQMDSPGPSISM